MDTTKRVTIDLPKGSRIVIENDDFDDYETDEGEDEREEDKQTEEKAPKGEKTEARKK